MPENETFPDSIRRTRFFCEEVLYLSVRSDKLYGLHKQMVRVAAPTREQIDAYFELNHFVPHMTLAKTIHGLSKKDLIDMAPALG